MSGLAILWFLSMVAGIAVPAINAPVNIVIGAEGFFVGMSITLVWATLADRLPRQK